MPADLNSNVFANYLPSYQPSARGKKRQVPLLPESQLNVPPPPMQAQPPVEDPSLLRQIGTTALSGLARVGNVLDLPGSSIREGLSWLSGVPRNPFDQWLPWNLTTDEHRLSGRDLNRQFGLSGSQDTYGNWWGGFATEVVTDPLSFTGILPLTKAGQAARAAGTGTKGLAASIKAGERSLVGLGLPFSDNLAHYGTGEAAQRFAANLDTAAGAVAASPPGRFVQGLFHAPVMGQFEPTAQDVAKQLYPAKEAAQQATREELTKHVQPLREARDAFLGQYKDDIAQWQGPHAAEIAKQAPPTQQMAASALDVLKSQHDEVTKLLDEMDVTDPAYDALSAQEQLLSAEMKKRGTGAVPASPGPAAAAASAAIPAAKTAAQFGDKMTDDMASHVFERFFGLQTELGGDVDEAMKQFDLDPAKMPPELRTKLVDLGNTIQASARALNDRRITKGGYGGTLENLGDFEYLFRYADTSSADFSRAMREMATVPGSASHRVETIATIPAEIVNRIVTDPMARPKAYGKVDAAEALTKVTDHIEKKYGKFLGKGTVIGEDGAPAMQWQTPREHAAALADWIGVRPEQPIFVKPVLEDFSRYIRQGELADKTYDVIHDLVAKNMGPVKAGVDLTGEIAKGQPKVLLSDLYQKKAAMHPERSLEYLAAQTGRSVDELKNMAVPHEIAEAIAAGRKAQNDPKWLGAIGDVMDQGTNFWKQSVTLPFPSFAGRNFGSGQYVNMTSGLMQTLSDVKAYGKHVQDALQMLRQGIDPKLEKELLAHDVFNPRQAFEGVDVGAYAKFGSVMPANPLDWRQTWSEAQQMAEQTPSLGEAVKRLTGKEIPLADRLPTGKGTQAVVNFTLGTGAKANQYVEFLNRVPMYSYLRSKGWTPKAAARKVKELQIDYGNQTFAPFENQVAKRLVPFYSFQRKIAPVILGNLGRMPGGPIAQTIRAERLATSGDPTIPDYVAESGGFSNPFKNPEDGTRSFITGLGLPMEGLAQYVAPPHVAARELLSQTNPLLKYPLEMATGQTFFQSGASGYGRSLSDLDPPIGRTLSNILGRDRPVPTPAWLEHLASNSPATRFISTARQLSDPRKTIPELLLANTTGLRVTDVSPAASDAILRDRAIELMRKLGAKTFSRTYFNAQQEAELPPEQQAMARQLDALQTLLAKRAKQRAKDKQALAMAK